MRTGFNGGLLKVNDIVVGINLGADCVSEHEWGIAKIYRAFGIPEKKTDGVKSRTITQLPPGFHLSEVKGIQPRQRGRLTQDDRVDLMLSFYCHWDESKRGDTSYPEKETRSMCSGKDNFEMGSAWDEGSFAVRMPLEKAKVLRDIYAAAESNDLAIWRGGGGLFQNAGLCLVIVSRLPKEVFEMQAAQDADQEKLRIASEATGIEDYLRKCKKGFFALSPRWAKDIQSGENGTQYPVVYWLNPMQQGENNYGWFTVEELMQWVEGKGPIPMTSEQRRKRAAQ